MEMRIRAAFISSIIKDEAYDCMHILGIIIIINRHDARIRRANRVILVSTRSGTHTDAESRSDSSRERFWTIPGYSSREKQLSRNQYASSMRAELARGKKRDSGGRALLKRRAVSIIVRVSGRTTAVCPARRPRQDKGTRFFFGSAATVFPFRREYHLARSVTSHLPSTCELFLSVARLSLATASRLSPRSSGSHAPGMSPPPPSPEPAHFPNTFRFDLRRTVSFYIDPALCMEILWFIMIIKAADCASSAVDQRSYRWLAVSWRSKRVYRLVNVRSPHFCCSWCLNLRESSLAQISRKKNFSESAAWSKLRNTWLWRVPIPMCFIIKQSQGLVWNILC